MCVHVCVIRQITLNRPAGYTCQASYLSYYHNQLTSLSG